jgi:hypothetical protein
MNQALPQYEPESLPLEPICSARSKSAHWPQLALNRDNRKILVHVEMKVLVPQSMGKDFDPWNYFLKLIQIIKFSTNVELIC